VNEGVRADPAAVEGIRFREQLLRRVVETVPLGLLHIGRSGDILYANGRSHEILGAPRSGSMKPFALLLPDDRTELAIALDGLLVDGIDRDLEVRVRPSRPSGDRLCLLRLRALADRDGEADGAIVWVEDVTERAAAGARAGLERSPIAHDPTEHATAV
jgi:PAS domain S-box-containing protein